MNSVSLITESFRKPPSICNVRALNIGVHEMQKQAEWHNLKCVRMRVTSFATATLLLHKYARHVQKNRHVTQDISLSKFSILSRLLHA
jgi:hypothetical protein